MLSELLNRLNLLLPYESLFAELVASKIELLNRPPDSEQASDTFVPELSTTPPVAFKHDIANIKIDHVAALMKLSRSDQITADKGIVKLSNISPLLNRING